MNTSQHTTVPTTGQKREYDETGGAQAMMLVTAGSQNGMTPGNNLENTGSKPAHKSKISL